MDYRLLSTFCGLSINLGLYFPANSAITRMCSGVVPQQPPIQLRTMFVRNVTDSACAFAVARLAAERCLDDLLPVSDLYGQ